MASRYWVGGTATWDATAGTKWALTSGGVGGQAVPTSADDVFLDAASGVNTVTLSGTVNCKNFDCTGFTGTVSCGAATMNCYGNFKLVAGMTYTRGTSGINFNATSGTQQVTLAGKSLFNWTGNAAGTVQLMDAHIANGISQLAGTINTNNQSVSAVSFLSPTGSAGRVVTLGTSTVTLSSTGVAWNMNVTQGSLTVNATSSTINCTGGGATFAGGGYSYGTVNLTGGGKGVTGSNQFVNLSFASVPTEATFNVAAGSTQTVTGVLTLSGGAANSRHMLRSTVDGTTYTIALGTTGTLTATDFTFYDAIFTGTGAPYSGTRLGDGQNNTGLTFPASRTLFWVAGTGNWSDATNHWSTTSGGAGGVNNYPLPQDDLIFDANSAATDGRVVTMDRIFLGRAFDVSALTHTVSFSTQSYVFHGNVTWSTKASIAGGSNVFFFGLNHTLTSNGATLTNWLIQITRPGETITLADDLNHPTYAISHAAGTFNANNRNVTVLGYNANSTSARTITMGSGTWTLTGTGTVWDMTGANLTLNANTSTIVLSDVSATAKTFIGNGKTYNDLSITGGGTGSVTIAQGNIWNNFTINRPKTVAFQTTATQTILGNFTAVGASGSIITLQSGTAGVTATLSKASGIVSADWLSVKDLTATGGAAWYAGANSTNVSNNTGWIFRSIQIVSPGGIATAAAIGSPTVSSLYTLSPSGIASAEAVGSPSLTARYTISPSGIASAEAIGSPLLTARYTVSPTGIPSAAAVGSPTLTARYTISPTGVPSAAAVGSPSLSARYTISPLGIASAAAVGSPSLSARYTISPLGIASSEAFGLPSIVGALIIAPTGIPSAAVVGSPTVSSRFTILPTGIPSSAAVGVPSLTARYTISPLGIASAAAVGMPVVISGALIIAPTGIPSAAAFGAPVVTSRYTITAAGIPSAAAVGSPSLTTRYTISPLGIVSAGAVGSPSVTSRYTIFPTGIQTSEVVGSPSLTTRYTISPFGIASREAFGIATIIEGAAGVTWPVIHGGHVAAPDLEGVVAPLESGLQDDPEGTLHGRVVRMRNGRTSSTSTGTRTK